MRPLAATHLLIVGLVAAPIMLYPITALNELGGDMQSAVGYSVLNQLVVLAGSFLLATGRYPESLFDFPGPLPSPVRALITWLAIFPLVAIGMTAIAPISEG